MLPISGAVRRSDGKWLVRSKVLTHVQYYLGDRQRDKRLLMGILGALLNARKLRRCHRRGTFQKLKIVTDQLDIPTIVFCIALDDRIGLTERLRRTAPGFVGVERA
jgi:hypothetical protein